MDLSHYTVLILVGSARAAASRSPVDPTVDTGRFAAVEFHYFMHMRVKTICILEPRLLGVELL